MVTMVCVAEEFFFFKSLILRERSLNRINENCDFSKYYQDKFFNVGKTKKYREKLKERLCNYLVLYGLKNEKSLISVLRK